MTLEPAGNLRFSGNRIRIPETNHGGMRLRGTREAIRKQERWILSKQECQNDSSAIT